MSDEDRGYELVDGMLAVESPQRTAARIIDLLKRGEVEQAREIMRRRAARVSATIAQDLAAAEQR
jgi:DNA-binding GntR family transcriptional regulator